MTTTALIAAIAIGSVVLAEVIVRLLRYHTRRLCVGILYAQWARGA